MLRNEEGEWIEDEHQLKEMVNSFYKNLFTEDSITMEWVKTKYSYPLIDEDTVDSMGRQIEKEEVKDAIYSKKPWKAPGPDGFPAGFFQGAWDTVAHSLIKFVQDIWQKPEDIALVNTTDICLIPKIDKPEFCNQFRPISLCNVTYKIVSKIIVNMLKHLMPEIISPYQTGFIPTRSIHENIVGKPVLLPLWQCH